MPIMSNPHKHQDIDGFPPGVSQPALRALAGEGYTRLSQLSQVTEADVGRLHGMGPKAIGLLRTALEAAGTSFKSSAER